MALEINRLKTEDIKMAKHVLAQRTYVVNEGGKQRLAGPKDKNNVFFLGNKGQEIDAALAEELGLLKAAKKVEDKAVKKGEENK